MPGRICAFPVEFSKKMRQYTFTSTILHLLINILLDKKPTKLYNEAEVDLRSKSTGYIKLLQF